MKKTCRFCQQKKIKTLFMANEGPKKNQHLEDYACTNSAFGVHGNLVRCSNCQIIYVDAEIAQEQVSTYYEVAADPLYFSEQNARKITFNQYLRKLQKKFPSKGKLLDVGTNTGLFVKLAKDNGWEALGLEPNKWAVEYAKKNYSIDLINKPFEKKVFKPQTFDIITMWDVIEHFIDPIKEIDKVIWLLKPGGLFAFSTVDPDSLLAKIMGTKWPWYMKMHQVFLNQDCAKKYLKTKGFKKIIFMPHFRNLSLGYLSTRLLAINPLLSRFTRNLVEKLDIGRIVVPYYANDLYDCYAYK